MRILRLGDLSVMLWLHTHVDPPADQFQEALAELGRHRRQHNVGLARVRSLVVTDGGAPGARQRAQLTTALDHSPSRLAVVTTVLENPIKRGVATALAWLNPDVRFFLPDRFRDAVAYLELGIYEDRLWTELCALLSQLPRAEASLSLVARSTGRSLVALPPGP